MAGRSGSAPTRVRPACDLMSASTVAFAFGATVTSNSFAAVCATAGT
jgi:hypothetical protein